jgi:hypothetical protein
MKLSGPDDRAQAISQDWLAYQQARHKMRAWANSSSLIYFCPTALPQPSA